MFRVPTLAHPLDSQILWARAGGWGPALYMYLLYRLCKIVSECKDGYNCWSTARMPSHIALQCADASLLPCPSGRRWRRRRHRTCVHRRARWRAPPRGTQRRTRHRRMTTVSSTSSFRRRRRRRRRGRLLGRQAAGRGSTFGGAGKDACTAPAHEHARALSAIDPCCGHELARLGSPSAARSVARASRRAAGKGRAQVDGNSCFVRAGTNVCSRLPRKRSTARRRCS